MKTIQPIVLSYNQPEETNKIYNKLIQDGFTNVIVVDNGSDKRKPAKCANLLLPRNIRAIGQIKMSLIYCMDYFPADYYWMITTSAQLLPQINYKKNFYKALRELSPVIDIGVLVHSLDSKDAFDYQSYSEENKKKKYCICHNVEPVAALLSHKLLEVCRKNKIAYFEKGFKRGWGADIELSHHAALNSLWCIAVYDTPIGWTPNVGYKKKLGGESLENYFVQATQEMHSVLSRKYGGNWPEKFLKEFKQRVKNKNFPYCINCDSHVKVRDGVAKGMVIRGINLAKKLLKSKK